MGADMGLTKFMLLQVKGRHLGLGNLGSSMCKYPLSLLHIFIVTSSIVHDEVVLR